MGDEVLTTEWLEAKLARERAEEKAEKEKQASEALREEARMAYVQETGYEPSKAELDRLTGEYRAMQTLERLAANKAGAARQIRAQF